MHPGTAVLAALWAAGALAGQVRVLATPEPLEVLRATGVRNLGVWSVSICNDGQAPRSIAPERVRMLLPGLRLVDPARAAALLNRGVRGSRRAAIARLLAYGAALATTFTGSGLVAANPRIIAGLAVGTVTLGQAAKWAESGLPDLTPFSANLLAGPVELPAGACATRTAFAGLVKQARPIEAMEASH